MAETLFQVRTTELHRVMTEGDPQGPEDALERLRGFLASCTKEEVSLIQMAGIYFTDVVHETLKEKRREGSP